MQYKKSLIKPHKQPVSAEPANNQHLPQKLPQHSQVKHKFKLT
jgi:hypothetical protein